MAMKKNVPDATLNDKRVLPTTNKKYTCDIKNKSITNRKKISPFTDGEVLFKTNFAPQLEHIID